MEYNDVYDENRQLTGKTHRRGTPWKKGEFGLVVCVWVHDGRGNLLLTRRADQITSQFCEDVTSELADCYIMLRQVQTMYGITDAAITEQIDRKELRQLERIDREILHYDP